MFQDKHASATLKDEFRQVDPESIPKPPTLKRTKASDSLVSLAFGHDYSKPLREFQALSNSKQASRDVNVEGAGRNRFVNSRICRCTTRVSTETQTTGAEITPVKQKSRAGRKLGCCKITLTSTPENDSYQQAMDSYGNLSRSEVTSTTTDISSQKRRPLDLTWSDIEPVVIPSTFKLSRSEVAAENIPPSRLATKRPRSKSKPTANKKQTKKPSYRKCAFEWTDTSITCSIHSIDKRDLLSRSATNTTNIRGTIRQGKVKLTEWRSQCLRNHCLKVIRALRGKNPEGAAMLAAAIGLPRRCEHVTGADDVNTRDRRGAASDGCCKASWHAVGSKMPTARSASAHVGGQSTNKKDPKGCKSVCGKVGSVGQCQQKPASSEDDHTFSGNEIAGACGKSEDVNYLKHTTRNLKPSRLAYRPGKTLTQGMRSRTFYSFREKHFRSLISGNQPPADSHSESSLAQLLGRSSDGNNNKRNFSYLNQSRPTFSIDEDAGTNRVSESRSLLSLPVVASWSADVEQPVTSFSLPQKPRVSMQERSENMFKAAMEEGKATEASGWLFAGPYRDVSSEMPGANPTDPNMWFMNNFQGQDEVVSARCGEPSAARGGSENSKSASQSSHVTLNDVCSAPSHAEWGSDRGPTRNLNNFSSTH